MKKSKKDKVIVDPKGIAGAKKMCADVVPLTAVPFSQLAMVDGAKKYGKYNWWEVEENLSLLTYMNACYRHYLLFMAGEDYARDSGVHHLIHLREGPGVLLDALFMGKVTDNRLKLPDGKLKEYARLICGDEYADLPLLVNKSKQFKPKV